MEVVKEDMPFWYELGCDVQVCKLQEGGKKEKRQEYNNVQNLNEWAS